MSENDVTVQEAKDVYIKILDELEYAHEFDDDGDIVFRTKKSDLDFVIVIDSNHLEFVRICCPNIYKITPNTEINRVYKACSVANLITKTAKLYVTRSEKSVWAAYETVITRFSQQAVAEELGKSLIFILLGIRNFISSLESGE